MADSKQAGRRPTPKPKHNDEPTEGTDYVVLEMDGEAPKRLVGRTSARMGREAIKALAKTGDSYIPGRYKAVAATSWDSDGNNLLINVQVQPVVSFSIPGAGQEPNGAEPAVAPEA